MQNKRIKGLSVSRACDYVGLSRYAHYNSLSARSKHTAQVVQSVKDKCMHHPRIGARKIKHLLYCAVQACWSSRTGLITIPPIVATVSHNPNLIKAQAL